MRGRGGAGAGPFAPHSCPFGPTRYRNSVAGLESLAAQRCCSGPMGRWHGTAWLPWPPIASRRSESSSRSSSSSVLAASRPPSPLYSRPPLLTSSPRPCCRCTVPCRVESDLSLLSPPLSFPFTAPRCPRLTLSHPPRLAGRLFCWSSRMLAEAEG